MSEQIAPRTERSLFPQLFTNNQLKIFALIAMTADHVGLQLLPQYGFLRVIGRLAFPIFAYMIAEGCQYTKNRKKHLLTLAAMAFLFQLVYLIAMDSVYQGIFVTFTLSVSLIFSVERAKERRTVFDILLAGGVFVAIVFLCSILPRLWTSSDFAIDYDLVGVLIPAVVYFERKRLGKLIMMAALLIVLALEWGGIQWFSLLALIPLACYNGKRGKRKMKNLFYIYYPAHLVVIYLLDLLL